MHRDIMAGHNICNVIQGHLLKQERPLYLQPKDENGNYPWMQVASSCAASGSNDQFGQKGVKREAQKGVKREVPEEWTGTSQRRKRIA